MRFLVRIFRHKADYSATVPDLPGCVAAADTVEDVRSLMTEAIQMHLEMMVTAGDGLPVPSRHLAFSADQAEEEGLCTWVEVRVPKRKRQRVS